MSRSLWKKARKMPEKLFLILNPTGNLRLGATYRAVVTTGVKDLAGNRMAANKVWYFTVRR